MRKPRTGEVIGTVTGIGFGVVLGAVVTRGLIDDGHSEGYMHTPLAATITNTQDRQGKPVGVRTYSSPLTSGERGMRVEAAKIDVVCIEPNGRRLIDNDVPAGAAADRGNDWYLVTATTDPTRQEWINTSYVKITDAAGVAALAECSTIAGLDPRGN